jgi:hypothetical protein
VEDGVTDDVPLGMTDGVEESKMAVIEWMMGEDWPRVEDGRD